MIESLTKGAMVLVVTLGLLLPAAQAAAQSHAEGAGDLTPGPRMIRTLEDIAQQYELHSQRLRLTPGQRQAIAALLQDVKKEMWLKEAALVAIFQALEDKRRYGLLHDPSEYRTANTLTGAIETDELLLFIEGLRKLQQVLTAEQRRQLQEAWRPTLTLQVAQGVTTKIALLSLEGIGRAYHQWRDDLHLTEAQGARLRTLLEEGRAELLRQGTIVDINRVEGDDLARRPDVDPDELREKMARTGDLEAAVFGKLFELAEQAEALLTADQRSRLRELRREAARRAGSGHGPGYAAPGGGHGRRAHGEGGSFEFFLDQAAALQLTDQQLTRLLELKEETRRTHLMTQAKIRGLELDLLAAINRSGHAPVSAGAGRVSPHHPASSPSPLPSPGASHPGASGHGRTPDVAFAAGSTIVGDGQGDPAPVRRPAALDTAVQQIEALRTEIVRGQVEAYLKAREILTAEQRARVRPLQHLLDNR